MKTTKVYIPSLNAQHRHVMYKNQSEYYMCIRQVKLNHSQSLSLLLTHPVYTKKEINNTKKEKVRSWFRHSRYKSCKVFFQLTEFYSLNQARSPEIRQRLSKIACKYTRYSITYQNMCFLSRQYLGKRIQMRRVKLCECVICI